MQSLFGFDLLVVCQGYYRLWGDFFEAKNRYLDLSSCSRKNGLHINKALFGDWGNREFSEKGLK